MIREPEGSVTLSTNVTQYIHAELSRIPISAGDH